MNRRALALIVSMTAVIAWLSLLFVGDTTVEPTEPRLPMTRSAAPPMALAPTPAPVAPPTIKPVEATPEPTRAIQPSPSIKTPQRSAQTGGGGVFDGSQLRGVASAMMNKAPEIQDCYTDWSEQYGELPGRFTLQVTVPAGGDGTVPAEAVLPFSWPEGESLENCVAEVLEYTRFTPPEGNDFQIMWPVPQVHEAGPE